jgi:hypothetical protein
MRVRLCRCYCVLVVGAALLPPPPAHDGSCVSLCRSGSKAARTAQRNIFWADPVHSVTTVQGGYEHTAHCDEQRAIPSCEQVGCAAR